MITIDKLATDFAESETFIVTQREHFRAFTALPRQLGETKLYLRQKYINSSESN